MFRPECLNCLCKVCLRSSCRYPCDICFARCLHSARPVMACPEFQHRARRRIYVIRKRPRTAADYLRTMSVADLIELVGEIYDTKRNRNNR